MPAVTKQIAIFLYINQHTVEQMEPLVGKGLDFTINPKIMNKSRLYLPGLFEKKCSACQNSVYFAKLSIFHSEGTSFLTMDA